ncbi:MAG: hypothetical protein Q9181_007257, partial [Wetmoreana brouardii]
MANENKDSHHSQQDITEDDTVYPSTRTAVLAMLAIALAIFLVALDRTIIGTATPAITHDFNSFGDIAWYEAGFLLPTCMLQLTFGRVYVSPKPQEHERVALIIVLITLVAVFELGSIVCAAAPSSNALIVGRVITGIEAAGIGTGGFLLINTLVPLKSRPKYLGSLGAVFGIASIVGPLLGGALTSVTWRWCFWINLPLGGISAVVLVWLTPKSPPPVKAADTLLGRIQQLDPLGFVLISCSTICVLFALQWGGIRYPWSDGRIIALFILFGVFGLAFIAAQAWRKEDATVPPSIFFQRTVFSACVVSIGIGSLLVIHSFYLPIWFQAIQGKNPTSSGLSLVALLLSVVFLVMICGVLTSLVGYYTPFLIIVDANRGRWISYQVVMGAGLGCVPQQPNVAVQTVLPNDKVATAISLLGFVQFLGGTIFVTVSQTLLQNKLISGLTGKVTDFDPVSISGQGATSLRTLASAEELPFVLDVYNKSLQSIWYVTLGLSCLVFIGSFGFEWRSVKKNKKVQEKGKEEAWKRRAVFDMPF